MTENAKKLLELLSQDKELAEKFSALSKEELLVHAKELGINMTEADLIAPEGDLTDSELSAVAGGTGSGACCCFLAGGGGGKEHSDKTYGCACVGFGQGGNGKLDSVDCLCFASGFGSAGAEGN